MVDKKQNRLRRGKRTRMKIRELGVPSLLVHKTSRHIYAQILSAEGDKVLAAVSTNQADIKADLDYTGNCAAAEKVGAAIAAKAKDLGIDQLAFDRAGYQYHGRVKALADAARLNGLKF